MSVKSERSVNQVALRNFDKNQAREQFLYRTISAYFKTHVSQTA